MAIAFAVLRAASRVLDFAAILWRCATSRR
jgi:hypothetical protein